MRDSPEGCVLRNSGPPPPPTFAGTARFRVERELGRGGMSDTPMTDQAGTPAVRHVPDRHRYEIRVEAATARGEKEMDVVYRLPASAAQGAQLLGEILTPAALGGRVAEPAVPYGSGSIPTLLGRLCSEPPYGCGFRSPSSWTSSI